MLIILYRKILQTDLEKKREKKSGSLEAKGRLGLENYPVGSYSRLGSIICSSKKVILLLANAIKS